MTSQKKTSNAPVKISDKFKNMTDTNLLLLITIVVFFAMYIGAIVFQGKGFLKPQTFFNILNANASLIILACGLSLVMITGGIDISVGENVNVKVNSTSLFGGVSNKTPIRKDVPTIYINGTCMFGGVVIK